jgi:hypothetical protein
MLINRKIGEYQPLADKLWDINVTHRIRYTEPMAIFLLLDYNPSGGFKPYSYLDGDMIRLCQ